LFDFTPWNGPSWSISTEFYTYLLFAAAVALSRRRIVLLLLPVAGASALALWALVGSIGTTFDWGLIRCIFGFSVGAITWHVHRAGWLCSGSVLELTSVVLIVAFVCHAGNSSLSLAAPAVFALAVLVFLVNLWWSRRRGEIAGNDPWKGATLEWAIPSPPPVYNFTVLPRVDNRLPLWQTEHHAPMTPLPATPPAPIHVPGGSWWPLVTAVGLPIIAIAALSQQLWLVFVGLAVVITGIYLWAYEPFEV